MLDVQLSIFYQSLVSVYQVENMSGFWTNWSKEDGEIVGSFFSSDSQSSIPEVIEENYRKALHDPYNKTGWSRNDTTNQNFSSDKLEYKELLCSEPACAGKRHCGLH